MSKATSALKAPPPGSGLPTKVQSVPPNQTLYIRGVPTSKIRKDDIKTALYMLFSTYGPVIDVVVLKTQNMRGQAHIVYRDVQTATQAMRALEGFEFLGSKLSIAYAKSKSDAIAKLDGTFRIPTVGNANVQVTDLQQSIFNAPPPGTAAASIPTKSIAAAGKSADIAMEDAATPESRGQKRTRDDDEDDDDDDDSDVAMEEESDDDD